VKRVVLIGLATVALLLGLAGPVSAANDVASCSGIAGSDRAGQAGAEALVQFDVQAEASEGGVSPGAIESEFSQFHFGSDCLGG
jgi:hypothetical protein